MRICVRNASEADGVDVLHVGVEEAPILLDAGVLLVLVEHGEDVGLDGAGVARRAAADVVDEVLVVDPGVGRRGGHAAGGGPAGLGDDEGDAGAAVLGHGGVERVDGGVEQVLVPVGAVLDDGAGGGEERVGDVDAALAVGVGEVGVDVGEQRRAGAGEEAQDGRHERLRLAGELRGGRRAVHGEERLRHRRRHLDVAQPRRHQRAPDVLHGRDQAGRGAAGDLVPDGDVPERHRRVGLDVVPHPRRRRGGAGGEVGEHVVGRADDDADPRAAHRLQRRLVRRVQPHRRDAVGAVHPHHRARRRQVVRAHAVAHPDRLRLCITIISR